MGRTEKFLKNQKFEQGRPFGLNIICHPTMLTELSPKKCKHRTTALNFSTTRFEHSAVGLDILSWHLSNSFKLNPNDEECLKLFLGSLYLTSFSLLCMQISSSAIEAHRIEEKEHTFDLKAVIKQIQTLHND